MCRIASKPCQSSYVDICLNICRHMIAMSKTVSRHMLTYACFYVNICADICRHILAMSKSCQDICQHICRHMSHMSKSCHHICRTYVQTYVNICPEYMYGICGLYVDIMLASCRHHVGICRHDVNIFLGQKYVGHMPAQKTYSGDMPADAGIFANKPSICGNMSEYVQHIP